LADGTESNPAEPGGLKFEFVLFGRERIVGEPQDLGTILHALGIPMVTREHTTTEYLGDIIGLPTVLIPRLVTWRDIGEIFGFLDPLFLNGYSKQVRRLPPRQHTSPLLLLNSQLVV
jgi:hypothetical protein